MVRVKVVRRREPGGLCRYVLSLEKRAPGQEQDTPIFLSNMFSAAADELAEELRFSADLNPRVKKTVCHYQVSFPPKEDPSLPTKQAIVTDLLAARGHGDNCQFFAVEHFDQVHKNDVHHFHVVASAVRLDGTWVNGDFEWVALRQVERDLEEAHGLRLCPPKPEREQQNLTTGESRLKERTHATLPKEILRDEIKLAAADRPTMPELVMRLKAVGVEVQFHDTDQKRQHKGLSFAIDGSKFQGGKLGKSYSLGGLKEHRQVSYEPERDDERLRELNGLSAEECRSRLAEVQLQEAAPKRPEVQIDQAALAQHLGALVQEIWQRERAERPKLKSVTFEEYSIQAEEEEPPQLFRQRELILETTANGYQGHRLTVVDGEAVERHERLLIQQAHERELQRQAYEQELQQQAERQRQAEDLRTRQAESILNFVESRLDNLKRKNKGHSLKTPGGAYAITRDPGSQLITITGEEGKVILQGRRAGAVWEVSFNQVQPEDVQAFTQYQKQREEKEKQQTQQPKQKQKQFARSREPGGLEL